MGVFMESGGWHRGPSIPVYPKMRRSHKRFRVYNVFYELVHGLLDGRIGLGSDVSYFETLYRESPVSDMKIQGPRARLVNPILVLSIHDGEGRTGGSWFGLNEVRFGMGLRVLFVGCGVLNTGPTLKCLDHLLPPCRWCISLSSQNPCTLKSKNLQTLNRELPKH